MIGRWGSWPIIGKAAAMAAEPSDMIPPEDDFELDILLAEMIGDGLIRVTQGRRLVATQLGNDRLDIDLTYTVQRAIPGAIVYKGWRP